MRNLIILLALCMSAFTFGQDQGQWSFGIGSNFTSTNDITANAGYFVMDGLMLSLEFQMMKFLQLTFFPYLKHPVHLSLKVIFLTLRI